MAEANTNTKQSTLSPEDAYAVLVSNVHSGPFFQKLSSVYNIVPQSADEARELLIMAAELRNASELENQKTASDSTNFLQQARSDLGNVLKTAGINPINHSD